MSNYKTISGEKIIQRIEFNSDNIASKYTEFDNLRATLINNYYKQNKYNFILRGSGYTTETIPGEGWNAPLFLTFYSAADYGGNLWGLFYGASYGSDNKFNVYIKRSDQSCGISGTRIDFGYIELVETGGQQ